MRHLFGGRRSPVSGFFSVHLCWYWVLIIKGPTFTEIHFRKAAFLGSPPAGDWISVIFGVIPGCCCFMLCPLSQKHDSVWIQGLCDRADSLRGSTGICGPTAGRLPHAAPELRPGLLWDGNWLQFSPCTLKRTRVLLGSYLVSAPAGVWHISEVRAAPGGDASSWSLLPCPVGHRPR